MNSLLLQLELHWHCGQKLQNMYVKQWMSIFAVFYHFQPGFHMSGKSQMIGDFTFFRPSQILWIYRICDRSLSQIFPIMNYLFVIGGLELSNLGDWYGDGDRCQCPGRYKFEFSFVRNDRRPSQKSGTCREKRNTPDSLDLSPFIPDDRGYLRFQVFISQKNLGWLGNSKIPDHLGFSRHMKTRL